MDPNRFLRRVVLLGLFGVIAACVPVTVNISFPQEKLEGAAGNIEDMVRSPENPKPATPPKAPAPGSSLGDRLFAALAPRTAEAQTRNVDVVPEVRVRTPELMKAIESRRSRVGQLGEWKSKGCIGETNQGLLEVRPGQGCTADVAVLIGAENADRNFIYQTLMEQNSIPASDAPRVRAAFAKARQDRARPGDWLQQPNGEWVKR